MVQNKENTIQKSVGPAIYVELCAYVCDFVCLCLYVCVLLASFILTYW